MMLYRLKGDLVKAIGNKTRRGDILRAIRAAGYLPEDLSAEYGYTNIRVRAFGGYVRIYKPTSGRDRGRVLFQVWEPVNFKYSGVPVFFG